MKKGQHLSKVVRTAFYYLSDFFLPTGFCTTPRLSTNKAKISYHAYSYSSKYNGVSAKMELIKRESHFYIIWEKLKKYA
jgi:hypothetical protein